MSFFHTYFRSHLKTTFFTGLLILLIGFLVIKIAEYLILAKADGVITGSYEEDRKRGRWGSRGKWMNTVVTFRAGNETFVFDAEGILGHPGERVKVLYDPSNPHNAKVLSTLGFWLKSYVYLLLAIGAWYFISILLVHKEEEKKERPARTDRSVKRLNKGA